MRPLTRHLACLAVLALAFTGGPVAAGSSAPAGCVEFETEIVALTLSGGPFPLPLASDPANGLGDSIEGFGYVDSQVTVSLSPFILSLGSTVADPVGGGCPPFWPAGSDGAQFLTDHQLLALVDLQVTDVDPRPGRDYAGMPDGETLFIEAIPLSLVGAGAPLLDAFTPGYDLFPPQPPGTLTAFNVQLPLAGDVNGDGDNDVVFLNQIVIGVEQTPARLATQVDPREFTISDLGALSSDGGVGGESIGPQAPLQVGAMRGDGSPDPALMQGPIELRGRLLSDLAMDFGDAPAPYPTVLLDDGARHELPSPLVLGAAVDPEPNGLPSALADGDGPDDDGVAFTSPATAGAPLTMDILTSGAGLLDAFVDFNGDGDWDDAGEQVFDSEPLGAGLNPGLSFPLPPDAVADTYARFRLSSAGGLGPAGPAMDGEVEDYRLAIDVTPDPVDLEVTTPVDRALVDVADTPVAAGRSRVVGGTASVVVTLNGGTPVTATLGTGGSWTATGFGAWVEGHNTVVVDATANNGSTATVTHTVTAVADPSAFTCGGVPATMLGTAGPDVLVGTPGDDVILGLDGDDVITAEFGDDLVCAGDGDDTVDGGGGADVLSGEAGLDVIDGGNGHDELYGGADRDVLRGQGGRDVVSGGPGTDTLYGNDGFDRLFGGDDADVIYGGQDKDLLHGGAGDDALEGGPGIDTLRGDAGDDDLDGGDDDDRLFGGPGTDACDGGLGTNFIAPSCEA